MDRKESIRKHTSDMLAVEQHILDAIQRQRDDDKMAGNVDADNVTAEIERVLSQHVAALEDLAQQYGAEGQSTAKEALTKLLGVAAGLYDKVRGDQPISRDLRDNYTALSLAAMGYTSYHTFGLAVGEEKIATLAQKHLKDLTPLMVEISKVLPEIVVQETSEDSDFAVDTAVGRRAVNNTQAAWSNDVTSTDRPARAPGAGKRSDV
jgi:ferritin-like metal-binding protein YciE